MTSQGAGASTDPLDLDEADRLAESIRPAWELDEGQVTAPRGESAAAKASEKVVAPDTGLATGGVDDAALDAAAQAFEPPRDTVIDGTPLIGVGKTDPGVASDKRPSGEKKAAVAPRPEPPKAAAKTQLGLEADDEPRAIASSPPPGPAPTARTKPGTGMEEEAPRSKPRRSRTSTTREASGPISEAKPLAGPAAGSTGPTFSRVDDPVEIPVEKGSKTAMYLGGAVLLVGAVVVGAMLFGGGEEPKPTPPKTEAPAETAKAAPKPEPPPPAATEKPAPSEPAETAEPEPTTTATAAPTSEPVADAPKPAADPPKAPSGGKTSAPPSGGSKPPSGGGSKGGKGGIMRDAPF